MGWSGWVGAGQLLLSGELAERLSGETWRFAGARVS